MTQTLRAARYRIVWSMLAQAYKIADESMGGAYCALPDEHGQLVQLSFRNGESARSWLAACGSVAHAR